MPLFRIAGTRTDQVAQADFSTEKALQTLIETNLDTIFNCRLVATEYSTGALHAGRIDTLAISEDNNPVIIEYKKVVSSELVNQSLFYLAWLADHKGDFEIAVQRALGPKALIDWSAIRVICIAPNYKKYDLHAVQVMGRSIKLWSYRRFANDTFYLEQIHQGVDATDASTQVSKGSAMAATAKRGAVAKKSVDWTVDGYLEGKPPAIQEVFRAIQEFMLSLDPGIEESPKKLYIAYRTTQNVVCAEVQRQKVLLFVKLDPKKHFGPKGLSRDVSKIGHFATGDLEISVRNLEELDRAKPFLKLAYEQVGG